MARLIVAIRKKISVKDINNVTYDVEVADTSLDGICFAKDVGTSVKYYGHHLGDGRYDFYASTPDDLPASKKWKLFKDNSTEIISFGGSGALGKDIADDTVNAAKITEGELPDARLSANIPTVTIMNTAIGVETTNRIAADAGKADLTGDNAFSGDNTFTGTIQVPEASNSKEPPTLGQMNAAIALITGPQTSANIIEIMMSGTEIPGKQYTTLAGGFVYAKSVNAADRIMAIILKDVNTANPIALGNTMENYIFIMAIIKAWRINLTNYSYTCTQNLSGFGNCTLYMHDAESPQTCNLNGLRLENLDIIADGTLNLTNVVFGDGVRILEVPGGSGLTLNINNCIGSRFSSAVTPVITGTSSDFDKQDYLTL